MKKTLTIYGVSICLAIVGLIASDISISPVKSQAWAQAKTLDELLAIVRDGRRRDNAENQRRIQEFRTARNR